MPRPHTAPSSRPATGKYRRVMQCMIAQGAKTRLCPEEPRLDGKLALVTGGTGGIGEEVAKGLARRGAEVIVAARGKANDAATCSGWGNEIGGTLEFLKLDLIDMSVIISAVDDMQRRWPGRKLDILAANAGISSKGYRTSSDGHEMTFAVNCLGHHLLIRLLQKRGLLADGARIVGTTGDIYILAEECTPDYRYRLRSMLPYCRSKLGNHWQYGELARRYPEICAITVHPGVVATGLEGPTTGLGGWIKRQMMLSPELGAQASLIAATQPGLASGSYFHNLHGLMELRDDDPARDRVKAAAFWETLEEIIRPHLA